MEFQVKVHYYHKGARSKILNQQAYERQTVRGELADTVRVKKISEGQLELFYVEDNSRVHWKKTTRDNCHERVLRVAERTNSILP